MFLLYKVQLSAYPKDDKFAWCVLNKTNAFEWGNFAHTLQMLYPCWSFFHQSRQQGFTECGFLLKGLSSNPLKFNTHIGTQMVRAMGCNQRKEGDEMLIEKKSKLKHHFYFPLFKDGIHENVTWFNRSEDAHALRDRFLSLYISDHFSLKRSKDRSMKIGLLNRQHTRVIINMDEIKSELKQLYPFADIECTTFENEPFEYQAKWFARMDVIFCAHGAAMSWASFIQKDTIVIQAYPPKYYPNKYYEPLIRISEGHAYNWHRGDTPFEDYISNFSERGINRMASFNAATEEVIAIFQEAIEKHGMCNLTKCK